MLDDASDLGVGLQIFIEGQERSRDNLPVKRHLSPRIAPQPLPKAIASVGGRLVWTPADWLSGSATFGQTLKFVQATGKKDLQDRGFGFQITLHPIGLAKAVGRVF